MQDIIAAGYNELARGIIDRAKRDRDNRPLERCELQEVLLIAKGEVYTRKGCDEIQLRCVKNFFKTEWFEGLCELADMDMFAIRRKYDFRTTTKN